MPRLSFIFNFLYGECSSVGRTPDCDSGSRGVVAHHSPFIKIGIKSGELFGIWKGRKHKEESKRKIGEKIK